MQLANTKEPEMVSGFINGLNVAGLSAQLWGQIATRPIVRSVPPLGEAQGDGAFVITNEGSTALVILELEASNPGNERNVLKWAIAHASAGTLSVQPGRDGQPMKFDRIEIVLCFGRESQGEKVSDWSDSDFGKTVAHCIFLTDLLNEKSESDHLKFSIISSMDRITDWSHFGRSAGQQFAERWMGNDRISSNGGSTL